MSSPLNFPNHIAVESPVPIHSPLGIHVLLECEQVAPERLTDPHLLEQVLRTAAHAAGATVIAAHLHHFGPQQGVTGVLLLQESHLSIHSWPEFGYAAVDIFLCGDCQPLRALDILVTQLRPLTYRSTSIARGPLNSPE